MECGVPKVNSRLSFIILVSEKLDEFRLGIISNLFDCISCTAKHYMKSFGEFIYNMKKVVTSVEFLVHLVESPPGLSGKQSPLLHAKKRKYSALAKAHCKIRAYLKKKKKKKKYFVFLYLLLVNCFLYQFYTLN